MKNPRLRRGVPISMIKTVIENDIKVEEFSSIRLTNDNLKIQKDYSQESNEGELQPIPSDKDT